jgi:hypothetical protein
MHFSAINRLPTRQLATALAIAVLLTPVAEARPIPGDRPMTGDPVIAPPSAQPGGGGGNTSDFHALWVSDSYQGAPLTDITLAADKVSDPISVTFTNEGPGSWDANTVLAMWDGTSDGPPSSGGLLCHDVPKDWASCGPGVAAWIGYGTVGPGEQGTFEFQIQPAANTPQGSTFYLRPAEKVGNGYQWINAQDADGLPGNRTFESFMVHLTGSTPPATAAALPPESSPGRAPLFVDCQPSTGECYLVPWPRPDATAQTNLARMETTGGHLLLDENHKLFVLPAHQNDFAPYPVWAGSYAPPGYEMYLCTNCFDASDTKHVFAHQIVYLHTLGDPVPQEVNTHAPADPHDLRVDSSIHFASELQPQVACDAPCDPADYFRRLALVLGAPFAAAAFPVLVENWLLPAAGHEVTAIGTAVWTRVATATGLSVPVVEKIVSELEQGTAPEVLGEDAVKVAQELETEQAQAIGSQTSFADPFGERLRGQLRQEVIDSTFDQAGHLRPAVLTDPETRQIIAGTELNNGAVRAGLTEDGSNLADWGKYETGTISNPDGTLGFRVHFYYNRVTGVVNYEFDYKCKFNGPVLGAP